MKHFFSIDINTNRVYGLDILRALAILFVVIGHGRYILPKELEVYHKVVVFDGVSIFFVLSGFLIGGILIKLLEKNTPSKELIADFWIRRWFRTLPNYFLILLVLLLFSFIYNDGVTPWSAKKYFVFAQNLFYPHPVFFQEAWSLSIEEWFYLITPAGIFLLVRFSKRTPKEAVIAIAISILLVSFLVRFYRYMTIDIASLKGWDLLYRKQVVTRLDSLMFGVIGASIHHYHLAAWLKRKKVLLILGITIFIVTKALFLLGFIRPNGLYNCVFSFAVISLATAFLLPYLSDLKSGSGKIYKSITVVSLISYSMYLLNLSVVQINIVNKIPWSSYLENDHLIAIIKYGIYWSLTILGSIVIFKYFELPTTRLRDKINIQQIMARRRNRHPMHE